MKKFIYTVFLCIVFGMQTIAQDVASYGYPCYMFNYIDTNCFFMNHINMVCGCYVTSNRTFGAARFIIPENEETIIYGIAITAHRQKDDHDSTGYTVYMYRVGNNNHLECIDSATEYSIATDFRYWGRNPSGQYGDTIVDCYEYYFSQPYVISDSIIYLGARWSTNFSGGGINVGYASNIANAVPFIDMNRDTVHCIGNQYSDWGGIFPIIKRGCDSCPDVHDMHFTKVGNSAALAQWDAGTNHNDWQLWYGPQGGTPDTTQAIGTMAWQRALTDLIDTAHYDVYIRAHCNCCSVHEWTTWAGPFSLCLRDIGIDEAAAPEVTLSPNPTTGKLTVGCEAEIKEVEMYDMQGRMISGKWKEGSGKCVVLDLAALPTGSYILVAHTTKGVATRTVEKR